MEQKQRCQSCGMPFAAEGYYGTNKDLSENKDYCRFCFQKGMFTEPTLTLDGMIEKSVSFMTTNLGFSEQKAREMSVSVISQLKRWKK